MNVLRYQKIVLLLREKKIINSKLALPLSFPSDRARG